MPERRRSLSLGSKSKSKLCQHSRMGQSLSLCQPSPGWSLAALCPHALARCRGATVCIHIFVTPSFKHRCFTLPLGTAHVLLLPPAFCHHMAVLFQYKLSLRGCMCVVPGHAARNGDAGLIHIQLLLASHVHAGDLSSTVLVQDRYAHGRWLIYSPKPLSPRGDKLSREGEGALRVGADTPVQDVRGIRAGWRDFLRCSGKQQAAVVSH